MSGWVDAHAVWLDERVARRNLPQRLSLDNRFGRPHRCLVLPHPSFSVCAVL